MGKAVKKEPIVSLLDQHKNQFRIVIDAADAFENHDSEGQKLLYVALERLLSSAKKSAATRRRSRNFSMSVERR